MTLPQLKKIVDASIEAYGPECEAQIELEHPGPSGADCFYTYDITTEILFLKKDGVSFQPSPPILRQAE